MTASLVLDRPVIATARTLQPARPTYTPGDDASESSLLARLRAGDEAAYAELVRATTPRLLATARRMLDDDDAARDVVQNAFSSAWRALPRFHGESKLSTWLHRIVVNAALMHLRAKKRRPEESIESLLPSFDDDGGWLEAPDAQGAPDASIDRERTRALVQRCIAQLPESHRTVIILRDIEELDTEQTAQALGISPEATKMRLHRARQALRTLLVRELKRSGE
jgi:RNA polymerase sigma-70 factor (ECF subfamily)